MSSAPMRWAISGSGKRHEERDRSLHRRSHPPRADGRGGGDVLRRHALGALAAAARGGRSLVGHHRPQGRPHRPGPRHPDPSRRHELHGEEVPRARAGRAAAAGRRLVPQPARGRRQSPARREGHPADLPGRTAVRLRRQPGPLGRYRRRLGRQLLRRRHRDLAGGRAHPAAAPLHGRRHRRGETRLPAGQPARPRRARGRSFGPDGGDAGGRGTLDPPLRGAWRGHHPRRARPAGRSFRGADARGDRGPARRHLRGRGFPRR